MANNWFDNVPEISIDRFAKLFAQPTMCSTFIDRYNRATKLKDQLYKDLDRNRLNLSDYGYSIDQRSSWNRDYNEIKDRVSNYDKEINKLQEQIEKHCQK